MSSTIATVFRQPLAPRPTGQIPSRNAPHASFKTQLPILKRPRSPEPHQPFATLENTPTKRSRTQSANTKENVNVDKQQRIAERTAREVQFREKYTREFPNWMFYFDTTDAEREALGARVVQLKARVANFFSNEVTHFISSRPIPDNTESDANKENTARPVAGPTLRSPIKLRGLPENIASSGPEPLIRKAQWLNMKIWHPSKLNSVLERCCVPGRSISLSTQPPLSLTTLLEIERRNGLTTERDPTQKRKDFYYFSKGSYFVLVEDINQELATIAALEYAVETTSDGKKKGKWPVPYCDPRARGPFFQYNEKDDSRREKYERLERRREEQAAIEAKKLKIRQLQKRQNDLRRSVSMSNLHRNLKDDTFEVYPMENLNDECGASGFNSAVSGGPPGYVAASGNSVSIASTYGTTSTIGIGSSNLGGLKTAALPLSLRGRLQNEVVTSRRVTDKDVSQSASLSKPSASSAMMPPPDVPRRDVLLRRCKSMNTVRLDKRDEKTKPGYCESCRQKFEDFKEHVRGRKHQKYANSEANFIQLDFTVRGVARPTIEEYERMEKDFERQYVLLKERALQDSERATTNGGDRPMASPSEDSNPVPNQAKEDGYVYLDSEGDES